MISISCDLVGTGYDYSPVLPCKHFQIDWAIISHNTSVEMGHTHSLYSPSVYRDETEPAGGTASSGSLPPMESVLRRDDDYPMCWQQVALVVRGEISRCPQFHWVTSSHPTKTARSCCCTDRLRSLRRGGYLDHLSRCSGISEYSHSCCLFTVHLLLWGGCCVSVSPLLLSGHFITFGYAGMDTCGSETGSGSWSSHAQLVSCSR